MTNEPTLYVTAYVEDYVALNILRSRRYKKRHKMHHWYVCLCQMCLLVTTVSRKKTIEVTSHGPNPPMGVWTRLDPRNYV